MRLISSIADLEEGVAQLLGREARFAMVAREGLPPLRRKPSGFATLAEILIEQMISLKAAAAIIGRLHLEFGGFDAQSLQMVQVSRLRGLGLSAAKAEALKAIAESIAQGGFDLDSVAQMEDAQALAALMRLKGIGPWSANIYLLSALARSDAWPAGDVALRSAVQSLFALDSRPSLT